MNIDNWPQHPEVPMIQQNSSIEYAAAGVLAASMQLLNKLDRVSARQKTVAPIDEQTLKFQVER